MEPRPKEVQANSKDLKLMEFPQAVLRMGATATAEIHSIKSVCPNADSLNLKQMPKAQGHFERTALSS
jgi:hypothetical protein